MCNVRKQPRHQDKVTTRTRTVRYYHSCPTNKPNTYRSRVADVSLISAALALALALPLPLPVTRLAAAVIHALPNNDSSHLRKSGICSIGLDAPLPYQVYRPAQISDSIFSTLPSAGGVELPTLGTR